MYDWNLENLEKLSIAAMQQRNWTNPTAITMFWGSISPMKPVSA